MPSKFFFLGFVVDNSLRLQLDDCDDSDKGFLDGPGYLERLTIDGTPYVGRRLEGEALSLSNVEDSARNVASLISRVAPQWNGSAMKATITALEEDTTHQDVIIDN